jgi:hypothetical protein
MLSCRVQHESTKEQRIYIKFCFKVEKTAAETHNMFHEAYSDDTFSKMMIYIWFKRFKNGRTAMNDERSGRPSTSRSETLIAQVKTLSVDMVN